MDAVTDSVQAPDTGADDGAFDVDAGVFDGFDARLENLFWKESDDGVLMVGNGRSNPEKIVSIALLGGELTVEDEDPETVDWRQMDFISRPESSATPQYD